MYTGCIALAALVCAIHTQETDNKKPALWMFEESIVELNNMLGCTIIPAETQPTTMQETNDLVVQYIRQMTTCLVNRAGTEAEASELKKRALAYEAVIVTLNKQLDCEHVQPPNLSSSDTQTLCLT